MLTGLGEHACSQEAAIGSERADTPTDTVNPLPKMLPGVVCQQQVRCGKAACRCATGPGHGPYFYRFWREGGRLRKVYVRRDQVADVAARCEARRREHYSLQQGFRDWRALLQLLRDAERVS